MIDKEKYFTVPEFAKEAGIAKQGIYEQAKNVNSKLYPYIIFIGKKIYISKEALKEYSDKKQEEVKIEQEEVKTSQEKTKDNKEPVNEKQEEDKGNQDNSGQGEVKRSQENGQLIIDILQKNLELLEKQLQEKDKQIDQLHHLLLHEQEAHKNTLLELESVIKRNNDDEEPIQENEPIEELVKEEDNQQKENLTWWDKFVKWWKSEP